MQRFYLIFFCTLGLMGNVWADKGGGLRYPLYQGVDCTLDGGHPTGWEDLGYHDEYCSHIVCERPGFCEPHGGSYVYDLPLLDYRGTQIIANTPGGSTALLRRDGGAITWGDGEGSLEGREDIRSQLESDVVGIHASGKGFAVLKKGGKLLTWVRDAAIYQIDYENPVMVEGTDNIAKDLASGVEKIFSGRAGFVALTKTGHWVAWRGDGAGDQGQRISHLKGDEVQDVLINEGAWAALKKDGSVLAWGNPNYGGRTGFAQTYLQDIRKIYATDSAFAALAKDGTVVTWGDTLRGGDSSRASRLLYNVADIVSTKDAFAAHRKDGIVVTWGGVGESFPLRFYVRKLVASRGGAFAALKWDRSVVTWGVGLYGGNSEFLSSKLRRVVDIYANYSGFAALRYDGSVVSWGEYTATDESFKLMKPYLVARKKTDPKRIETIVSSPFSNAFFAIRRDGSFISWGRGAYPYHNTFYDILDDPVWSKVYPDLEYVHYFGILPKRRQ